MKVAGLLLIALGFALALVVAYAAVGAERGATQAAPAPVPVEGEEKPVIISLPADPREGRASVEGIPVAEVPREIMEREEPAPEPPAAKLPFDDGSLLRAYYDDGQLEYLGHQIEAPDGRWLREGPWEAYHPNGALHELGAYENDAEVGEWRWFHENGAKMAVGRFDAGKRVGAWTYWFEDGKLQAEASYANGKAHGPWTTYHENGVKGGQGEFKEGELSGPWTVWYPDGTINLESTGTYENGVKVGD